MPAIDLPYFDRMLATMRAAPDAAITRTFEHVHWGWYAAPAEADASVDAYRDAAAALTDRVVAAAGIRDGMSVLDVGCGFGATVGVLNATRSGCELVGLNIDERQLDVARERVEPANGNHVSFVRGNATALPFAPGAFDVVLAIECIFHFSSRRQFFAETGRVLRHAGALTLSDFTVNGARAIEHAQAPDAAAAPRQVFFGSQNQRSVSVQAYERIASRARFDVVLDDDITAAAMPTYPALRRLYDETGWDDAVEEVAVMEDQARAGILEYRILSFARRPR